MKVAVLSDIHGNLEAMNSVSSIIIKKNIEGIILLGDLIDYCPHSNEVIEIIKSIKIPILCNIAGNHEFSIINDSYDRFSSLRGKESAIFTKISLNENSMKYIKSKLISSGKCEFSVNDKSCLAVHGSLQDTYWKAISPDNNLDIYKKYDYVFSGHSHIPHYFEKYFYCSDLKHRNKKKTIFINPGSVGQPRNHNPNAQFSILDFSTGQLEFIYSPYNISKEQSAFSDNIDIFYKTRLEEGI